VKFPYCIKDVREGEVSESRLGRKSRLKMGDNFHPRLNISETPIVNQVP
jgi:hypothetical protein